MSTMNHRYSSRKPISLEVDLFLRGRCLGRFRTRNVSLVGLFVEGVQADLYRNNLIELSLWIESEQYAVKGLVIHTTSEGVGVLLVHNNRWLLRSLHELLQDSRSVTETHAYAVEAAFMDTPHQSPGLFG